MFDKTTLVSEDEANLLKRLAPELADKIDFFSNGVDTEYFSPDKTYPCPYSQGEKIIVFTGAMDYWANVDAVKWFAEKVFPSVLEKVANVKFYIVGSNPLSEVAALEKNPDIVVTGRVEDIRPYIYFSTLVVAPLRIARGIQNKVLEAMSMAKPVLLTPAAAEGISAIPGKHFFMASKEKDFRDCVLDMLEKNKGRSELVEARSHVLEHYSWDRRLDKLAQLLKQGETHHELGN